MTTDLYLPRPASVPDPGFRETVQGGHALVLEYSPGHALVVEYGDCEFRMECQCGTVFVLGLTPDQPWTGHILRWLSHRSGPRAAVKPHCQCRAALPRLPRAFGEAELNRLCDAWEHHTMTGVPR